MILILSGVEDSLERGTTLKMVIAGAAGSLGMELVRRMTAEGHQVIALDAVVERLQPLKPRLAGLHALDLRQPQGLQPILQGADVVFTTVGVGRPRALSDYAAVDYQANLNLLQAACAAGVGKFVYTSVLKVDSDPRVPLLNAKFRFEQALKNSGLPWLVLRPSGYFTDLQRTFLSQAQRGSVMLIATRTPFRFSPIHPADVAAAAAAHLKDEGLSLPLGGPEEFTYDEIARMCFTLLGRPPVVRSVPLPVFDALLVGLRALNPPLWAVMRFLRWASTTDLTAPKAGSQRAVDFLSAALTATPASR